MSEQPDFVYGTAVFKAGRPGEIVVTREGDVFGEPFQGPAEAPPRRRDLAPTPWRNVPGAEWRPDETGCWVIAVYRDADVTPDRPS